MSAVGSLLDVDYKSRILEHLKLKRRGVTITQLYRLCRNHIEQDEMRKILDELHSRGIITFQKQQSGGRPKVVITYHP